LKNKKNSTLESLERASRKKEHFVLRLFISGTTPQSQRALAHLRRICETFLPGRYKLEVIDIYQDPERARKEHIIAVPTLIKVEPNPLKRLVGDLSDEARVLKGLGIIARRA
jgi:circadian clock protein KaiB